MLARAAVATMYMAIFVSAFVGTDPDLVSLVKYSNSMQIYDGDFERFPSIADARKFIAEMSDQNQSRSAQSIKLGTLRE